MRKGWAVPALSICLTSILFGYGQEGVLLRLKFQTDLAYLYEGQTTINMTMNLPLPGQDLSLAVDGEIQTRLWQRAEEVDRDGVATVIVTQTGKMRMMATGLPGPGGNEKSETTDLPRTRVKLRIDPLGRVLHGEILEMEPGSKQQMPIGPTDISFAGPTSGMGFTGLPFPEKPVKEGDDWDATQPINLTIKDRSVRFEVKGRGRLTGFETIAGRRCAVLEHTYEIPDLSGVFQQLLGAIPAPAAVQLEVSGTVRGTAKHWFDPQAGQAIRQDGSADFDMTMTISVPQETPVTMTMKGTIASIQRLSKILKKKE